MLEIILITGLLVFLQLTLPTMLAVATGSATANYLAGPRDVPMENMAASVARAKRAGNNLLETLPVFLTLAVLSIIMEVQTAELAAIWLGLRVAYVFAYIMHIDYIRTLIWFGSVFCLIMMGLALI
ncbi:MAG: hypothetical protein CM15mP21_6360 [Hyphomicrobiales bacterium]|nr:MAG: hypothetical protein CM15mP21_6360 [Hyphomicrobiales bacterium]